MEPSTSDVFPKIDTSKPAPHVSKLHASFMVQLAGLVFGLLVAVVIVLIVSSIRGKNAQEAQYILRNEAYARFCHPPHEKTIAEIIDSNHDQAWRSADKPSWYEDDAPVTHEAKEVVEEARDTYFAYLTPKIDRYLQAQRDFRRFLREMQEAEGKFR
jgi:hypothetical protein